MKFIIAIFLLPLAANSQVIKPVAKPTLATSVATAISNTTSRVCVEKVAGVASEAVNNAVSNVIQQVTQDQLAYLLKTGQGRYLQYHESEPVTVDGYAMTFSVDEFLGPRGVGYVFRFYLRKDGRTWTLTKGQGPGYADGPEGGWVEVIDNKPI